MMEMLTNLLQFLRSPMGIISLVIIIIIVGFQLKEFFKIKKYIAQRKKEDKKIESDIKNLDFKESSEEDKINLEKRIDIIRYLKQEINSKNIFRYIIDVLDPNDEKYLTKINGYIETETHLGLLGTVISLIAMGVVSLFSHSEMNLSLVLTALLTTFFGILFSLLISFIANKDNQLKKLYLVDDIIKIIDKYSITSEKSSLKTGHNIMKKMNSSLDSFKDTFNEMKENLALWANAGNDIKKLITEQYDKIITDTLTKINATYEKLVPNQEKYNEILSDSGNIVNDISKNLDSYRNENQNMLKLYMDTNNENSENEKLIAEALGKLESTLSNTYNFSEQIDELNNNIPSIIGTLNRHIEETKESYAKTLETVKNSYKKLGESFQSIVDYNNKLDDNVLGMSNLEKSINSNMEANTKMINSSAENTNKIFDMNKATFDNFIKYSTSYQELVKTGMENLHSHLKEEVPDIISKNYNNTLDTLISPFKRSISEISRQLELINNQLGEKLSNYNVLISKNNKLDTLVNSIGEMKKSIDTLNENYSKRRKKYVIFPWLWEFLFKPIQDIFRRKKGI